MPVVGFANIPDRCRTREGLGDSATRAVGFHPVWPWPYTAMACGDLPEAVPRPLVLLRAILDMAVIPVNVSLSDGRKIFSYAQSLIASASS
jgi:hypothetical protein